MKKIKKYHIHVYKTIAVTELDVEAESSKESLDIALDMIKAQMGQGQSYHDLSLNWQPSDCELISLSFESDKPELKRVN